MTKAKWGENGHNVVCEIYNVTVYPYALKA
jgi:hypothetical protein